MNEDVYDALEHGKYKEEVYDALEYGVTERRTDSKAEEKANEKTENNVKLDHEKTPIKVQLVILRTGARRFSYDELAKIDENAAVFPDMEREFYNFLFVDRKTEDEALKIGKWKLTQLYYLHKKMFKRIDRILSDTLTDKEKKAVMYEQAYQDFLRYESNMKKLHEKYPELSLEMINYEIRRKLKKQHGVSIAEYNKNREYPLVDRPTDGNLTFPYMMGLIAKEGGCDAVLKRYKGKLFLLTDREKYYAKMIFVDKLNDEEIEEVENISRQAVQIARQKLFGKVERIITNTLTDREELEIKCEKAYQKYIKTPADLNTFLRNYKEIDKDVLRYYIKKKSTEGKKAFETKLSSIKEKLKAAGGLDAFFERNPAWKNFFTGHQLEYARMIFVDGVRISTVKEPTLLTSYRDCFLIANKLEMLLNGNLSHFELKKLEYEEVYKEFLGGAKDLSMLARKHKMEYNVIRAQIMKKLRRDYGDDMTIPKYNERRANEEMKKR